MTAKLSELEHYAVEIEALAKRLGLDYYDVDFEMAPASLMTEIAVYGLPVGLSGLGAQDDVWRAIREFFGSRQDEPARAVR